MKKCKVISIIFCFALLFPGNVVGFDTHQEMRSGVNRNVKEIISLIDEEYILENIKNDELRTHPWLTKRSLDRSRLNSIANYEKRDVLLGSILEDFDIIGNIADDRHEFYTEVYKVLAIDPLPGTPNVQLEALEYLGSGVWAFHVERAANHFYSGGYEDVEPVDNVGRLEFTGENQDWTDYLVTLGFKFYVDRASAMYWALKSNINKMNLAHVKDADVNRFEILGHLLHLLQDMAVPEHVRNDAHAWLKGGESPYEHKLKEIGWFEHANWPTNYQDSAPVPPKTGLYEYFEELSKFTRKHFFSQDTVFSQDVRFKLDPLVIQNMIYDAPWWASPLDYAFITSKVDGLDYRLAVKKFSHFAMTSTIQTYLKTYKLVNSNPVPTPTSYDAAASLKETFGVDHDDVVGDYWKIMRPMIISYCTGFIDRFFDLYIATPAVSISITPSIASLLVGGSQQFTAEVTGSANQAVIWSVQEGSAGGTVTSGGLYTAPNTAGTYHIVVTSQADNTKSAIATVTVNPPLVVIPADGLFASGTVGGPFNPSSISFTLSNPGSASVNWTASNTQSWVTLSSAGGTLAAGGTAMVTVSINSGANSLTVGNYSDTVAFTNTTNGSGNTTRGVDLLVGGATASWESTRPMSTERNGHTATLLPNNKVLVAGGYNAAASWLNSAELYDPITGTWSGARPMSISHDEHTATLLPSGKVLVAGGWGASNYTNITELYDPATDDWTTTGRMNISRGRHTATLLLDGRVLVAGGEGVGFNSYLSSAELYDPASGIWSKTGRMTFPRSYATATRLLDGKVLVTGGTDGKVSYSSAELYDPTTGIWSTMSMNNSRGRHTATLLSDGKVLVVGGFNLSDNSSATAELYDSATGTWSTTGSMAEGRDWHIAVLLSNNKVLVAGGASSIKPIRSLSSAELYDPSTGTWSNAGSMSTIRMDYTATLLPNGKVLVAGGLNGDGWHLSSSELYNPGSSTLAPIRVHH